MQTTAATGGYQLPAPFKIAAYLRSLAQTNLPAFLSWLSAYKNVGIQPESVEAVIGSVFNPQQFRGQPVGFR